MEGKVGVEEKKGKIRKWLTEEQEQMRRKGNSEEANRSSGKKANFFLSPLRKVL